MDAFGHVHIINKTSNLSVSVSEIIILREIHLLFLNGSHQAFSIAILFGFEGAQRNIMSKDTDPESIMDWESQARIDEQKIALIEVQIYQNQSRLKGYDKAFTHLGIIFEHELISTGYGEAQELYTEEHQQNHYVTNLRSELFDKAEQIIDGKRN